MAKSTKSKKSNKRQHLTLGELIWWARIRYACGEAIRVLEANGYMSPEQAWNSVLNDDYRRWASNMVRDPDSKYDVPSHGYSWRRFRALYVKNEQKNLVKYFSNRLKYWRY